MSTSSINLTNSVLDVGAIVDNLIYFESTPVRTMQSQVSALQSKISAYQSLNTKLSALADKLNLMLFGDTQSPFVPPTSFIDRLSGSIFARCAVTSSNEDRISATASNAIAGGTYMLTVSSLAQAQSMASSGFADANDTSIGTGTLTIATGGKDPVTVTIGSANATLSAVRDAINNANAGVTATIINDGSASPFRLLIRANDAGTANAFTIIENLSGGPVLNLTQTQAASDAQFTVNGVPVTKSTNTVSDVIDGVTFTLKQESTAPVTLTVEKDIDSIVAAFREFVSAYNAASSFINAQFSYSAATGTAGVLAGDSTLRRIQSNLQSQITQSTSSSLTPFHFAGQCGLEFNRDGSLTLDEAGLREALSDNFAGVAGMFLGDGGPSAGAGTSGILMGLSRLLDGITDSLSGPIHNATDGLSRNIDALNDSISAYQMRLDKRKALLTDQFNQADQALRLLSVMQAQLGSQIATLANWG